MMTIQQALETIHQQIQTSTQLAHRPESAVIFHCVLTLKKDVFRNTEKARACQTQN